MLHAIATLFYGYPLYIASYFARTNEINRPTSPRNPYHVELSLAKIVAPRTKRAGWLLCLLLKLGNIAQYYDMSRGTFCDRPRSVTSVAPMAANVRFSTRWLNRAETLNSPFDLNVSLFCDPVLGRPASPVTSTGGKRDMSFSSREVVGGNTLYVTSE